MSTPTTPEGKTACLARLKEIPIPPRELYEEGIWPEKETKLLAVVGSRALTAYGKEACEKLIAGLAGYPISIVSGLALGADAIAHKSALRAGLHSIAVPGSGLHESVIYPRSHAGLARDIVKSGGLLLSEHMSTHCARPYDFPSRNRIMVGISHAVLVVEAGPQSGTLITARLTHEYNRDLLCIPHRIGDTHGYGSHLFLRLGATLVSESEHILEMLGIEPKTAQTLTPTRLPEREQKLYVLLTEPASRDALIRTSGLSASEVLSALVTLELEGFAKEEFGLWRRV
jgi:DNA processing protein